MSNRFQNIFAILAHSEPDSLEDLIKNLKTFDTDSLVLLYDGSEDKSLYAQKNRWIRLGSDVVEDIEPQRWGYLHSYAIGCMKFAQRWRYDTITFVDSDQLLIRSGYTEFLAASARGNFGILSSLPVIHGADSNILAVRDFHADRATWLPYLSRFNRWQDAFVRWTFWPGTVISSIAAMALVKEFESPILLDTIRKSRVWSTEECVIPTVSALLGFDEVMNPCDMRWCRFRTPWTIEDVLEASLSEKAFFLHPVPRKSDDILRRFVARELLSHVNNAINIS